MNHLVRSAAKAYKCMLGLIVVAIFIDILLQVASRMTPGNAISWTIEIGEILLAALIWLGISVGVSTDSHIRFDMVYTLMPAWMKRAATVVSHAVFAAFLLILARQTLVLLEFYQRTESMTPVLRWSKYWTKMPMLIGCCIAALNLIVQMILVASGKKPAPGVQQLPAETEVR